MVLLAEDESVHILDLPQLYMRPAAHALEAALNMLATDPPTFSTSDGYSFRKIVSAPDNEIASYLTRILSSALGWLSNAEADNLRDLASRRLTERSGRTAMSSLTRSFCISKADGQEIEIRLHEPALTGDNLGHKTWSSSYAVARLLPSLLTTLDPESTADSITLELGAGTGLLGLAYSALTQEPVLLTDLAAIVPNLARNITLNAEELPESSSTRTTSCATLDWTNPAKVILHQDFDEGQPPALPLPSPLSARLILAADPIYAPEHPAMLVQAISTHLEMSSGARVLLAYPVSRAAYLPQIGELKRQLESAGLEVLRKGEVQNVRDDWAAGVTVEWAVWAWGKGFGRDLPME